MTQNQPQKRVNPPQAHRALGRCLLSLVALLLMVFGGTRNAAAFAFIGPLESWMSSANGFNPLNYDGLPAGPHNIGEEFRRNTPVMYWTCDETFLDFFGSNGVFAIEQAFSAFNTVGSVSSYSMDLSEWPMESQRFNYQAQALNLLDLKSTTMQLLMEQMGLAYPTRYMWVLHNRAHIPNTPACPDGMDYLVVQRNFDPVPSGPDQYQESSYINGTLYSYFIDDICTGAFDPIADAIEFPVDSEADAFTAIADPEGLNPGGFYLSLTRDDVGGLRYLLQTNNINRESLPPQAIEFVTNDNPQLVFGSNLTLFAAQALTNNAAALTALYPGLVIVSTTNIFGFTTNTIITGTLVPGPAWAPAGTFQLVFTTNTIRTPQLQFIHTFGNVASFQLVNGQWTLVPFSTLSQVTGNQIVNFQTISTVVTNPPFLPAQDFQITTVTNNKLRILNGPVGEFVILQTNTFCDLRVLDNIFTNVVATSNLLATGTNIIVTPPNGGNTNVTGTNLFNGQVLSNSLAVFTYFTNHAFYVQLVTCQTSNTVSTSLFQGIDHVSFIRHDFDSLLGRFFQPVTNDYVMNEITNGTIVPRSVRRVITQPDFVFSASDLIGGPAQYPVRFSAYGRNVNFNGTNGFGGVNGPGTIEAPSRITFNKGTPVFENFRDDPFRFVDELTRLPILAWGSFDGTTNAPIVYPNGADLSGLQNTILLPISPDNLPLGQVGVAYSQQYSSLGGQAPLTFSLAPGSNPLPPGFSLAADGTLSGIPATAGNFEFTVRLADATGRIADRLYTFVVSP